MEKTSEQIYNEIVAEGILYIPATNHYNDPQYVVNCDRCKKTSLYSCYGHKKLHHDLCFECYFKIKNKAKKCNEPDNEENYIVTMMQYMYRNEKKYVTFCNTS